MTSTCIFGSRARNRLDDLSDRDVLIVAPSDLEIADASRQWANRGWSVARFTHQQMVGMADRRSLFLQHLKQEGIIINDEDGFLSSLIHRYVPKTDYGYELRESFALLAAIRHRPSSYWLTLCAADIAYVAIRNIAISRLAEQQIYTFDYYDLIKHFMEQRPIAPRKSDALVGLRALKHGYRNRLATLSPSNIVMDALEGAEQLFGVGQATIDRSGYFGLRMVEFELMKRADPRALDLLPLQDPLGQAWALICDPRDYPKISLVDEAWVHETCQLAQRRFRVPVENGIG
jgi:hypothetical protein